MTRKSKEPPYCQFHGGSYRVRVRVPDRLREILGTSVLIESLKTADPKAAEALKYGAIGRLKERIRLAEQISIAQAEDPLVAEALKRRLHIKSGTKRSPHSEAHALPITLDMVDPSEIVHDDEHDAAVDRAYEIEKRYGYKKAKQFSDLVFGHATPILFYQDDFVHFKAYPLSSVQELGRVLKLLETWLTAEGFPVTLQQVGRREAAGFISGFLTRGRTNKTASKLLSFIREYWKWLIETGRLEETASPWTGQSMPKVVRSRDLEFDPGKRPFTDRELATLLYGPADVLLSDAIRIGALSGLRVEEICRLTVDDCRDGLFRVHFGKTDNARRTVPIHPDLVEIIARRTSGKKQEDYIINELPPVPKSREGRSDPLVKRFTRYRRRMGIDERVNGKRVSNVDQHSLRRYFIRAARNAMIAGGKHPGFDAWTLAAVVGHSSSETIEELDLSQKTYAGPDPEQPKRKLVEAVKLPKPETLDADHEET